jgi:hypothetical protein
MRTYCTLSDSKYLKQGVALINSLKRVSSEEFILYYLCLDAETYEAVRQHTNVHAITLADVEKSRPEILQYKRRKPYNEYCWSLASTFSRYLLESGHAESVMYVDSDIYFYSDPLIIFKELGDRSIGIIRHRHNTSSSPDGEYNVGIIYFKNDKDGLECLRWWNDCLLNDLRPDLATCGDQKYLEEFPKMYNTAILDETFAHGAPWNYRLYVYDNYHKDGTLVWGNKVQPLVFNHFSRFSLDHPTSGNYADHTLNFQVFAIPALNQMYREYAQEVR